MSSSPAELNRPQYTVEEMHMYADHLPGFEKTAEMSDIFGDLDTCEDSLWQPVLSATIVTKLDGVFHVLTGKRTAEGNTTHVNVASTPTMRLSPHEAGLFLLDKIPFCLNGEVNPLRPFVSESVDPSVARLPDSTDILSTRVAYLLALKLQLGTALEVAREPIGRASIARYIAGFSHTGYESSEPVFEPLIMFGAVVGLRSGIAQQIPEETVSYANLGWAPIDQYVHGVATRTVTEVIPNASLADELEVCVKGLCNATSSTILRDPHEIQYHLSEGGVMDEL
jgi:hypothetical protein